jgi:hypothetical protein
MSPRAGISSHSSSVDRGHVAVDGHRLHPVGRSVTGAASPSDSAERATSATGRGSRPESVGPTTVTALPALERSPGGGETR